MKFVACYIRVSSIGSSQGIQRREINRWLKSNRINPKAIRWYIDKSATLPRRPKFDELQADILDDKIRAVVVAHLDRLSTSPRESLNSLIDWCGQSLRVVAVSQQIDIMSKDGAMITNVLRGVAEMDRRTRRERTQVGLASARARGRAGGRPKLALDDPKLVLAKELQKDHTLSIDTICQKVGISRSTYYRYVAR
jgi:DNA invertase Pin-like site-specific DNA recombinase